MVSGLGGRDVVREYFGLSWQIRGAYLMDDGIGSPGSFFVKNQVAPQAAHGTAPQGATMKASINTLVPKSCTSVINSRDIDIAIERSKQDKRYNFQLPLQNKINWEEILVV